MSWSRLSLLRQLVRPKKHVEQESCMRGQAKNRTSQFTSLAKGRGCDFELTGVDGRTYRLSTTKARKSILNSGLLGVHLFSQSSRYG